MGPVNKKAGLAPGREARAHPSREERGKGWGIRAMSRALEKLLRLIAVPEIRLSLFNRFLVGLTYLFISKQNIDLVNGARKLERYVVVLADRGASVFANVEGFIGRNTEGNGSGELAIGRFLSVDIQRCDASFAKPATVILEVDHDRVFSGRKLVRPGDGVALDADKVVMENRLTIQKVETPPIESSALCDQYTFSTARGNIYVGSDAE